jgi:hypothetical protein
LARKQAWVVGKTPDQWEKLLTRIALVRMSHAKERLARIEKEIQWIEQVTDRDIFVRVAGLILTVQAGIALTIILIGKPYGVLAGWVVYFGSLFGARIFATRFSREGLKRALQRLEKEANELRQRTEIASPSQRRASTG